MAKLMMKISNAISEYLRPGEELRSVGQLTSGLPYWLSYGTLGVLALIFTKPWWAGVAGNRLILIQLDSLSRPRADRVLSIPLDQIEVKNKSLFIDHMMTDNSGVLSFYPDFNTPAPLHFRCHFGHKRLTGLDVEQFLAALSTPDR